MSELTVVDGRLPAQVEDPAEAELEMRRHQALLDVVRRGRGNLREQTEILLRIIEYAVRGVDLVDEMRERGELVEADGGKPSEVRTVRTINEIGLTRQRVAEWRSLRDHDALGFVREALAKNREPMFQKASVNWVRQRVERIARENATPDDYEPVFDYEIRHGDQRGALDDLAGTVDAIITDPPYPEEFLDEFDALGELAARLLTDQGLLVVMVGQTHLPEYLKRLGAHLTYRWCGAYLMEGPAARIHGRKVGSKWKPLLIFDRGGSREFLTQDVFSSAGAEKQLAGQIDGWGQSESGMADIIGRLTNPGQFVVDPFLGAGTTAVACHQLGRRFVGCDIDADAVRAARERLAT